VAQPVKRLGSRNWCVELEEDIVRVAEGWKGWRFRNWEMKVDFLRIWDHHKFRH